MNIPARRTLSILVLASLLLFCGAGTLLAAEYVSVIKDGVNLRSGPATNKNVLFQLPAGYPLQVLETKGKWLKVQDFEKDKGWIYAPLVNKKPHVIVTVKEGNVRSGPGTNYDKVGSVTREVILRRIERKGDWLKVSHPKLTGWLHSKLVWPR